MNVEKIVWEKDQYTVEEVMGVYNGIVQKHINDCKRVPARDYSAQEIEKFAKDLHNDQFKDILHPFVIDQYKA